MKKIRWIALLLVLTVFIAGCTKQQETTVEEETQEEEVVIPYKLSSDPTELLSSIYDDLSEAYKDGNDKQEAEDVAAYFTCDFFTWSNKTSREDIGGVNYVIPIQRESFASTAIRDYYVNFAELTEQYGQENLPEVIDYDVSNYASSDFIYDEDGYRDLTYKDITVNITYKESKLYDVSDLQSSMIVTVVCYEDTWYVVGVNYANA